MVKDIFRFTSWMFWLAIVLSNGAACAQDVEVQATVQGHLAAPGVPLRVTVVVTGPLDMEVDGTSFTYDDIPVAVEHLGDSTQTSLTIINGRRTDDSKRIATYRFLIPAQDEGLHVLDPVTVSVDGREYRSESSTYQIEAGQSDGNFRLEATVDGPSPLYPGQRATLTYRIYFKDDIELTVESLPLFDLPNFKPVGDKQFKSSVSQGFHLQEITQEVEAEKPGDYEVPGSVIEGYAYNQDMLGRRRYRQPKLRATAPPFTVIVSSFPEEGQPATFSGAVGEYSLSAELLGSGSVRVGDRVTVRVTISGSQLHTVTMPSLSGQREFSDRFRLSDLPPIRKEVNGSVVFDVELRPLSAEVVAVPPVAFSFYDPKSQQFRTVESDPIPLKVVAIDVPKLPVEEDPQERDGATISEQEEVTESGREWDEYDATPPIEIAGSVKLDSSDFWVHWWSTVHALWIVVVGIGGIYLVSRWRGRSHGVKAPGLRSEEVMEQARSREATPDVVLPLVGKALLMRLAERGHTAERAPSIDLLPTSGPAGEVRALLMRLEEERFSGGQFDPEAIRGILKQAEELFAQL